MDKTSTIDRSDSFEARLGALEKRQQDRREKLDYLHEGASYSYVEGLSYTKVPKQEQIKEKYVASGFYAFILNLIAFICVFYTATVFGLTVFTMGLPLIMLFTTDPAAGIVIYGIAFLAATIASWLIENEESPICPKNSGLKRKKPARINQRTF